MRLLGALVLLVQWSGIESEGTPYPPSLSTLLPAGEAESRPNGSLAGSHWPDVWGTRVYACQEAATPCLRQCCGDGRIIAASISKPEEQCELLTDGEPRGELLIPERRASPVIREQLAKRTGLADWFELVPSPSCPKDMHSLPLDPLSEGDAYELYPNGSLWVQLLQNQGEQSKLLPSELFCLDRGRSNQSEELVAIVCVPTQQSVTETPTAIWIGYLLSIPFLGVTFVVYAIIPELKNIYGKTLMCYVLSLLVAYASLLLAHSLVIPFCGYTDIRSALEKDSSCGKNERFSACAPSCERICDDINNDNHAGERCNTAKSCENKCICQDGYVREKVNGKCIRLQECPRVKH